ncbi:hypothetical protein GCM10027089_34100 [Nocardia thraciensis]
MHSDPVLTETVPPAPAFVPPTRRTAAASAPPSAVPHHVAAHRNRFRDNRREIPAQAP